MPRTKPTNKPADKAADRIRRILESKTNYHSQSSSSHNERKNLSDSDLSDVEENQDSDATVVVESSSDEAKHSTTQKNSPAKKKASPAEAKNKASHAHFNSSQETCSYTDRKGVKKRRYRPGRFKFSFRFVKLFYFIYF